MTYDEQINIEWKAFTKVYIDWDNVHPTLAVYTPLTERGHDNLRGFLQLRPSHMFVVETDESYLGIRLVLNLNDLNSTTIWLPREVVHFHEFHTIHKLNDVGGF